MSAEEKVSIKVLSAEKVKPPGLFSLNYVVYHIRTEPLNVEVKRRYKQFEWLHQSLRNRFPVNYVTLSDQIPGLPPKVVQFTLDEELAHSRLLSLQQYLDQVCENPVLKYSPELVAFLTKPEDDLLHRPKPERAIPQGDKFINDKSPPMKVFDLEYPGGRVNLMMDNKLRAVTQEISLNVDKLTPLENEAVAICKEIHALQERLGRLYHNLGGLCGSIAANYKALAKEVQFPNIAKLSEMYGGLQLFMKEHARMAAHERKNFGDNIQAMFEFSLRELEGIKAVSWPDADRRRARALLGQLPEAQARVAAEEAPRLQDGRRGQVRHAGPREVHAGRRVRGGRKAPARQGQQAAALDAAHVGLLQRAGPQRDRPLHAP